MTTTPLRSLLLLAPAALAGLTLTAGLAPPASAATADGPAPVAVVHGAGPVDHGRLGFAATGCAGGAATTRLAPSYRDWAARLVGDGSLRVVDGARSVGGPVLGSSASARSLASLVWPVYPVGAAAPDRLPRAQWRVVLQPGGAVLTSERLALRPDRWNRPALADATLTGDAFSGSIATYLAHHRVESWTASLRTGACLASGEVYVDDVTARVPGTRRTTHLDLEPSTWVTGATTRAARDGSRLLVGRLHATSEVTGGDASSLAGHPLVLERRVAGQGWRAVASVATDRDGAARLRVAPRHATTYRWRWTGEAAAPWDRPATSTAVRVPGVR